jgi:hypothetical protein
LSKFTCSDTCIKWLRFLLPSLAVRDADWTKGFQSLSESMRSTHWMSAPTGASLVSKRDNFKNSLSVYSFILVLHSSSVFAFASLPYGWCWCTSYWWATSCVVAASSAQLRVNSVFNANTLVAGDGTTPPMVMISRDRHPHSGEVCAIVSIPARALACFPRSRACTIATSTDILV